MQRKEDRGWNKTVREGGSERERKCLQPRGQEFGGLRRRGLGGMSEVGVRGEGANLMGFGFDHPRHESHRRILAKKFNHKKLTLAAAPKMRSQGAALKLQRAQRPGDLLEGQGPTWRVRVSMPTLPDLGPHVPGVGAGTEAKRVGGLLQEPS